MTGHILIANTTVPTAIDYPSLVGVLLLLLVGVLFMRYIRSRGRDDK